MSGHPALYAPDLEAAPDWPAVQNELARKAFMYALEKTSEFRRRAERVDIDPLSIRGVSDLPRIPVLAKDQLPELQEADPPFGGMLATSPNRLRRVFASPGPILDPQGMGDDSWGMAPALWAAGFRPGQIVLNTFSYHMTPAGLMMDAALRTVGATVIPGGVGNTGGQIEMASSLGATGYVGTPQFLVTLLEKASEGGVSLDLERALVTGGPFLADVRTTLEVDHGIDAYECYGTADAGCLGYDCDQRSGWHVAPGVVIEITDPDTGEPVSPGETGEVVVTKFDETYPLVRFGTGDLSAFVVPGAEGRPGRCACGRTSPRLRGFLGRSGGGVKVKGMFVHPRQLSRVLSRRQDVARYQGLVTAVGHKDHLTVRVEPRPGAALEEELLQGLLTDAIGLRLEVQVVEPGTIPEDARRVIDER